jgi:very-short-patch-repair endonuclease
MTRQHSPQVASARRLRRDATDVENRLWYHLRARQVANAKFRRQEPIGPYVVDFCCVEAKLVVELDGGQHADRQQQDQQRSAFLNKCGFRVLRFWNHDVLQNIEAVVEQIAATVRALPDATTR